MVEIRTTRDEETGIQIAVLHDPYGQISDAVAAAIRETRKQRGWSVAELAERCDEIGAGPITANVIENIESGRRKDGKRTRDITVDELVAIAQALGVHPAALMPELGQGPLDVPLLFGLDDAEAGLQAALSRIGDVKERLAAQRPAAESRDDHGPDPLT